MSLRTFHLVAIAGTLSLAIPAAPALAQSADDGFTRRHIDAEARRSNRVLLRDWPELSGLLAWTRRLEAAVVDDDETLSAELIGEFRARVDSLASRPVPEFMTSRRDSVNGMFGSIRGRLDRAEAALEAAPPTVRAEEGAAPNAPDRKRTLVTGRTAVTVPAGVAVGDADTLPRAAIEGEEPQNYVDLVALALADLDRLVHLVRKAGSEPVNGSPATTGRAP